MASSARQGTRIIATGCTSGLGYSAIRHLLQTTPVTLPPPYHVVLLARNISANEPQNISPAVKVRDELRAIAAAIDTESTIDLIPCDLSSLTSTSEAATTILSKLQGDQSAWKQIAPGRIDVLFLNAAVAKSERKLIQTSPSELDATDDEVVRDQDGRYEETALVNHVSQQYLVSRLVPTILSTPSSTPPRIVFTGSALHRRLQKVEDLDQFFNPRQEAKEWTLIKSYGASKFLQTLGVDYLARLLRKQFQGETDAKIEVVVVQPGFIPNTGLTRESAWSTRLSMSYVLPLLPVSFITTVEKGAENLSLALSRPLTSFAWSKENCEKKETTTWDGETVKDGLRTALIVKDALKEVPDSRAQDEELGKKWWPSVAQHQHM
ncbi:unnamed protein product [Sympodiomycopsis kandeliae]